MFTELKQRYKDNFFYDLTALGGVLFYFLVTSFFLLKKEYSYFFKLSFGFILLYTIVIIIRYLYFKERPKKYNYSNAVEKIDASSFPSLHVTRMTFVSAILMSYLNDFFYSIIISIFIAAVGYSRIYLKKHDLMDVLSGIIVGLATYLIMTLI